MLKNPVKLLSELKTRPEKYWIKSGESMALGLFRRMSERVPAYKDFLKKQKIDAEKIKTIEDFKSVPLISKDNYLRQYPKEALCWDGKFADQHWVISATSGSTGEPFYFPRQALQDEQYAVIAELFLRANFRIHERKTLFIVGFPMGAWIGGLFTYQVLKMIAERGNYKLSIITPGINKLEILKAVKNLGSHFDQILIGAYGPFLKDFLDDGGKYGIDWKSYRMGFIFAAEGFSELFRDYVIKKAGLKNQYTDTLNIYGTVDLGTMAHETPLSILIRKIAVSDENFYKQIFPDPAKLPTLAQYIPELFFFEDVDGNLICSAESGIPLVRYDLKDHGGVFTMKEMGSALSRAKRDMSKEIQKAGIGDTVWNLPFVHVYERSNFSVSFFAFQVYPETVRRALQTPDIENQVTGKFTMAVKYDKNSNQYLDINVELKAGVRKSAGLHGKIREKVTKKLIAENSEYRKTAEEYPDRVVPKINFWPYEDPVYFKPGVKQRWVGV